MACGKVQFQTDLSEANFDELCGATARRHTEPAREGCELPRCGGHSFCKVTRGARQIFLCSAPQADLGEGRGQFWYLGRSFAPAATN